MSTWLTIKDNIRTNLGDAAIANFSIQDINDSCQDAYNEVVAISQCILKKTTLSFLSNTNYYDLPSLVPDFMAMTAGFNNNTNLWLLDDKTLKDFDRDRVDWELWTGQPVWWAPCNDGRKVVLVPKLTIATGNFDLYYWAVAPTIIDSESPLVPPDFESLIECYATADLLEQFEEFTKAQNYWKEFWGIDENGQIDENQGIGNLCRRTKNIAQSDLVLLA